MYPQIQPIYALFMFCLRNKITQFRIGVISFLSAHLSCYAVLSLVSYMNISALHSINVFP